MSTTTTDGPRDGDGDGGDDGFGEGDGDVPLDGFDPEDLDEIYQDAFEGMGLDEDQAECLTDHIIDAIDSGDISEEQALADYLSFLEDCDISMEDLSAN